MVNDATCSAAYTTTTYFIMASNSPWIITAKKNILAGYDVTVCIECTNGVDTITLKNYRINQVINTCSADLSAATSAPSNPTLTYNGTTITETVASSYTVFFASANGMGTCPISSCIIKAEGCSLSYASVYPVGRTSIATSTPWAVTSFKNVNNGYIERVCVECTNGF